MTRMSPLEIRQLSASALHSLAPKKIQAYARDIILDDSESDELKTMSLTALTSLGMKRLYRADNELQETVRYA